MFRFILKLKNFPRATGNFFFSHECHQTVKRRSALIAYKRFSTNLFSEADKLHQRFCFLNEAFPSLLVMKICFWLTCHMLPSPTTLLTHKQENATSSKSTATTEKNQKLNTYSLHDDLKSQWQSPTPTFEASNMWATQTLIYITFNSSSDLNANKGVDGYELVCFAQQSYQWTNSQRYQNKNV